MTTQATETSTATPTAGETTQTAADTAVTSTEVTGANPEAKAEEQKGTEAKADTPVVYDFKLPEGVELDAGAADKFKAVAAELKLPAEGAQKVIDLYAGLKQAESDAFKAQVEAWGEQVKSDTEYGGAKLDENLAAARKAMDAFGSPELKSLLNSTGMGNHPEMVRMMVKIGQQISEDGLVRGKAEAAKPRDPASVLYGSTNA